MINEELMDHWNSGGNPGCHKKKKKNDHDWGFSKHIAAIYICWWRPCMVNMTFFVDRLNQWDDQQQVDQRNQSAT